MSEFLGIQVEILAGIIIPCASGAAIIAWRTIRYFQKKEICFQLQKQTIENQQAEIAEIKKELKEETQKAHDTHTEVFKKLNTIEKNIVAIAAKEGISISD